MTAPYPKELDKNLDFRAQLLMEAQRDEALRAELRERFFADPLWAFNVFFWTYDPRPGREPHHLPFITYPFQDEYIREIHAAITEGYDTLTEKSRDMGCSWMWVCMLTWFWLQSGAGNDFLVGSRKEEFVDKVGNMDTLLEKIRYTVRRLPAWMRPKGFKLRAHMTKLQIYNPETGAVIKGEANNANFGSGGRYKAVLLDEFAKWEWTDKEAWEALADTTQSRNALSSPKGTGNAFAELRFSGTVKVLRLHWSAHPLKAEGLHYVDPMTATMPPDPTVEEKAEAGLPRSPWYYEECKRRAAHPTSIRQELDIDYERSGNPRFNINHIQALREWVPTKCVRGQLTPDGFVEDETGHLAIYEAPNNTHDYVIGVDVAEGNEDSDFSGAIVFDRTVERVVAILHGRINEVDTAYLAMRLGYLYEGCNPLGAKLVIDTTGVGIATARVCDDEGYLNLYMRYSEEDVRRRPTSRLGYKLTPASKKLMLTSIAAYLEQAVAEKKPIPVELLDELSTVVIKTERKVEADVGCYDDMVIMLGLALRGHEEEDMVRVVEPSKPLTTIAREQAMRGRDSFYDPLVGTYV